MKLIRTGNLARYLVLGVLAAAAASCGDVARSSDSPSTLVINSFAPSSLVSVVPSCTAPSPCSVSNDIVSASLTVIMKDLDVMLTAPTFVNNAVTINRYHVEYRRADGRNTPGVDVPYPIDGGLTLTIGVGQVSSASFELVRHSAKQESPLRDLHSSMINTIAFITFFGSDQAGNDVSATGTMQINFRNVGN